MDAVLLHGLPGAIQRSPVGVLFQDAGVRVVVHGASKAKLEPRVDLDVVLFGFVDYLLQGISPRVLRLNRIPEPRSHDVALVLRVAQRPHRHEYRIYIGIVAFAHDVPQVLSAIVIPVCVGQPNSSNRLKLVELDQIAAGLRLRFSVVQR